MCKALNSTSSSQLREYRAITTPCEPWRGDTNPNAAKRLIWELTLAVMKTNSVTLICIICSLIASYASSFAVTMPVKHIVMFRFKEGTTDEEIQGICQELLALPKAIDCIRSYEVGQDLLLEGGQKHPLGPNRRVAWTATFDSTADYETYNSSEAHLAFLQKLKPLLDPGSRAAIQYEIPSKEA
jgi:hypothetical protein